jgi:transporter family-2 protein
MTYIFIAFSIGLFIVVSMLLNSKLAEAKGPLKGSRASFIAGLITISTVLLFSKEVSSLLRHNHLNNPIWAYAGGIIYVLVLFGFNAAVPNIPIIYSTILAFAGQLFSGLILDYIIYGNFSIGKLIGFFLILAGGVYNIQLDFNKQADLDDNLEILDVSS